MTSVNMPTLIAAVVASAKFVPPPVADAMPGAQYVRIAYADDYSSLPAMVRHEIEAGISSKLGLSGWRMCAVDEVDDEGEVWVFTTKATMPDPVGNACAMKQPYSN